LYMSLVPQTVRLSANVLEQPQPSYHLPYIISPLPHHASSIIPLMHTLPGKQEQTGGPPSPLYIRCRVN
jgi:hypothetical protein